MNGLAGYAGAIVSPNLTAAIESTRQALSARFPARWPEAFGGDQTKQIDHASSLLLWQPDVRATVLQFEAVAGMAFETDKKAARLVVYLADPKTPPSEGNPRSVLVTMSRPSKPVLEQQAGLVVEAARDRLMPKSDDVASRDRLSEITAQVVPPFAFWSALLPIQPDRMPRTIELIQLALALCSFAEQRFKHALAVPRPQYFNPNVVPAILTPGHGSLPSGHATEAFAVSIILHRLVVADADSMSDENIKLRGLLLALAARIANNRMIAGLHTPIDTAAGRMLGTVLADYLVARCTGCETLPTGEFFGADLKVVGGDLKQTRGGDEGDLKNQSRKQANDRLIDGNPPNATGGELLTKQDPTCNYDSLKVKVFKSDALGWLWDRAREEWGHAASGQ